MREKINKKKRNEIERKRKNKEKEKKLLKRRKIVEETRKWYIEENKVKKFKIKVKFSVENEKEEKYKD